MGNTVAMAWTLDVRFLATVDRRRVVSIWRIPQRFMRRRQQEEAALDRKEERDEEGADWVDEMEERKDPLLLTQLPMRPTFLPCTRNS